MEAIINRIQSKTVLVVEDDVSTLEWLVKLLKIYFKEVYSAENAVDALEIFTKNNTDIVIADIQLPQIDGITLLQKISSLCSSTVRVVMTAHNSTTYQNRAVLSDIDFYLKKPIDIDELLVYVASKCKEDSSYEESLGKGFVYNREKKVVLQNEKVIKLTKKEVLLLELLLDNKNNLVTIDTIETKIWKEPVSLDALRMIVVNLRKKLFPELIENLKGLGYKITL